MESASANSSEAEINGPDSPTIPIKRSDSLTVPELCHHDINLLAELDTLRQACKSLQTESSAMEEEKILLQREKDEAVSHNGRLTKTIDNFLRESDSFGEKIVQLEENFKEVEEEFEKKIEGLLKEKEGIKLEIEVYRERIEVLEAEKREQSEFALKSLDSIKSVKQCFVNIIECLDDEKVIEREAEDSGTVDSKLDQESRALWEEIKSLPMLANKAETKVIEYKEVKKKEKKELENSVVSLTEENRDINSLLRIALVEKEAVEKSLNRLKGGNEQKRVALLQIAERGLQRVGFGFMMGSGANEQSLEGSAVNVAPASNKSDSSECEEEVVSLVCMVNYAFIKFEFSV